MATLADALTLAGSDALRLFWWPVALWTVAAIVAIGLFRLLPQRLAREQYELRTALLATLPIGIGLAALFRALSATPLISVPLPYELVVFANGSPAEAGGATGAMVPFPGVPFGALILAATAALAALAGAVRFAIDVRSLKRLDASVVDVTDPAALRTLAGAVAHHGILRKVRLAATGTIKSPAAYGVLRPTVLVPHSMLERPAELRLVLLHETAHLASGDFALDAVARIVHGLFGWHPLVRVLSRSQTYWREAACDLAVLQTPDVDPRTYAHVLLSVARSAAPARAGLVASMSSSPSQLKRRIEAMSRSDTPVAAMPLLRHIAVAALFFVAVSFTACSDSTPAAVAPADAPEASGDPTARLLEDGAEDVFVVVEQMPAPVGGLASIISEVKYPETAKKAGVQGRVIVEFIVGEDGSVRDAAVVRGVDPDLDAEALRVVEAASWEAGRQRGQAVAVKLTLPVTFKLE